MPFSGKKKSSGRANHVYLTGKTSRFDNQGGGFSRGGYGSNQGQSNRHFGKPGFDRGAGSYHRGDVDGNRAYPEQSFNRGYDRQGSQGGYGNENRGNFGRKPFNKPYGEKPYGEKRYGDKPYGDKPYGEKKFGGSFGKNRDFNRGEKRFEGKKHGDFRPQGRKAFNIDKTVTGKIYAGKRTYTFEFQKTENGDRALAVTQTRDDKGRERMDTIMIFHDHIDEFVENVNKVAAMINKTENENARKKQDKAEEDEGEEFEETEEVEEDFEEDAEEDFEAPEEPEEEE